jgi:hypothetical protein
VDVFVMVSIVVSFATLVTAHLALAAGLAARPPWWHALVALLVPPLAPYWGFREKMRARAVLWGAALVLYAAARAAAHAMTR